MFTCFKNKTVKFRDWNQNKYVRHFIISLCVIGSPVTELVRRWARKTAGWVSVENTLKCYCQHLITYKLVISTFNLNIWHWPSVEHGQGCQWASVARVEVCPVSLTLDGGSLTEIALIGCSGSGSVHESMSAAYPFSMFHPHFSPLPLH